MEFDWGLIFKALVWTVCTPAHWKITIMCNAHSILRNRIMLVKGRFDRHRGYFLLFCMNLSSWSTQTALRQSSVASNKFHKVSIIKNRSKLEITKMNYLKNVVTFLDRHRMTFLWLYNSSQCSCPNFTKVCSLAQKIYWIN